LNIASPFAKSKYKLIIDSELVVRTKDEKDLKNNELEIVTKIFSSRAVWAANIGESVPFA